MVVRYRASGNINRLPAAVRHARRDTSPSATLSRGSLRSTELRPALAEAIAVTLDAAVFGGINKPASWPAAVVPAAFAAGNTVELGNVTEAINVLK